MPNFFEVPVVQLANQIVQAMGHWYSLDIEEIKDVETIEELYDAWVSKHVWCVDALRAEGNFGDANKLIFPWRRGDSSDGFLIQMINKHRRRLSLSREGIYFSIHMPVQAESVFEMWYQPAIGGAGAKVWGLFANIKVLEENPTILDFLWTVSSEFPRDFVSELQFITASKGAFATSAIFLLRHHEEFLRENADDSI